MLSVERYSPMLLMVLVLFCTINQPISCSLSVCKLVFNTATSDTKVDEMVIDEMVILLL